MAQTALIGFSGFVGTSLCQQGNFDKLYNSKNIDKIEGEAFNSLMCAAP